ncbi:ATP-binding protein [Streptomyces sp. CC224B]|uniref:ATP-binding protein n=1 Tax=Streptomyces sp. CC224B TaxID=3044571 RepID=UPI0024A99A81|nr:ATP-binding protein [Streptomyces sp. CC224B]
MRKSLLSRLLVVSVLVSVLSIAATAWLAAQTTSGAIRQEQGQVLADDARIYDRLLGLAATTPNWRGADRTVRELSTDTGRRIALTTQDRKVIADSAEGEGEGEGERGARLPARASAVVDPLAVDSTLAAGRDDDTAEGLGATSGVGAGTGAVDRIDPRAVGPFRLPAKEREDLRSMAEKYTGCVRDAGVTVKTVEGPSGRPYLETTDGRGEQFTDVRCGAMYLNEPTRTERRALDKITKLAEACMRRKGTEPSVLRLTLSRGGVPRLIALGFDGSEKTPHPEGAEPGQPGTPGEPGAPKKPSVAPPTTEPAPAEASEPPAEATPDPVEALATSCVDSARREQLGQYVSSPALLFITSQDGSRPSESGFQLSGANTARLVGLAAAILAVTVAVTAFAATRLTRPLRALTTATQRMKTGEATEPVPARSAGEISQLAAAFNDMAAHRRALEEQRKAMVSDVAHELRTPLSNIRGWLEAAEDGVVATDPELVTSLLEEALLLQHIVDDLQDLAAADAGTLRLHREPACAAELAEQVVAAHQARADAAGVRLSARAEGDPWLTADPLRLRQAVGNLVSNAIRHTPAGGSVTVTCRAAGEGWVTIEVADTGTGIAAGDLPHVFDRFWRADKSRTRATGGSGLGLAIVRNLARAHGGEVEVESEVGAGTRFTLRLPVT